MKKYPQQLSEEEIRLLTEAIETSEEIIRKIEAKLAGMKRDGSTDA